MKRRVLIGLVVVLALAATAAVVWANGGSLVSYWPFDEGTGTIANDAVNGNHGTLVGDPTYDAVDKAPVVGNAYALDFDGNDHVRVPNSTNLNILVGSWGLWLKFDSKPSDVNHHMNPLAKAEQYWVHASLPSADTTLTDAIQAKIRVGGRRYVASTAGNFIQTGVWYHVVGTYDGDTLKVYVDGRLEGSNDGPSGPLNVTTAEFAIGTWSYHVDYFHGLIDEVGLWDRALTADEVAALSGSVWWLPPIALDDWTLNERATLPIKFQLYDRLGNLLDSDVSPILTVTREDDGSSVDLPLTFVTDDPENPYHYHAIYKPGQQGTYTAVVKVAGVKVGDIGFVVTEPPVANGRGKSH